MRIPTLTLDLGFGDKRRGVFNRECLPGLIRDKHFKISVSGGNWVIHIFLDILNPIPEYKLLEC
jgi:hypothetical protein